MIIPMKKVCLMVQKNLVNEALLKLRDVGVVHIEKSAPQDSISKSAEKKLKIESAMGLLSEIKSDKKKKNVSGASANVTQTANAGGRRGRRSTDIFGTEEQEPYSLDAVRGTSRPYLPDLIVGINRERKAFQERKALLVREISRIRPWGDFNPSSIKEIALLGFPVFLYELSNEVFSAVNENEKNVRFIKMDSNKTGVRIIVLDAELPGSIPPVPVPEKSITDMTREIDEINLNIEELDAKLKNLADRLSALKKEMAVVETDIEFDNAAAVMEKVDDIPAEYGLMFLTGYVPAEDLNRLKTAAAENNWALTASDPASEDSVPTLLRNNRFVNLLEPLTSFLEVSPGYNEVDISPFFLLFFCIFFGMIFGDAGYGALLLLAGFFGLAMTLKKGVPRIIKLLLLLGFSNLLWGTLTCSWFGIGDYSLIPQFLKNISLPLISNLQAAKSDFDDKIVQQNLMVFCFSLALLQLSIGHILAIFHEKSLKAFGHIGSIAMLAGMYFIILNLIASNEARTIPMLPQAVPVFAAGFLLNFIFGSYEGSIGRSILDSCKNIISVILGIANVFSDIMSYIRLWAVGLAGAAIASTVNTMAGPMFGHLLFFIFGLILVVFGHGLNIVLNTLSVLVHGVRLNTLEFSGHVGLTWAGFAYKPFAKRIKK